MAEEKKGFFKRLAAGMSKEEVAEIVGIGEEEIQ